MFTNDDVTDNEVSIGHIGHRGTLAWDIGSTIHSLLHISVYLSPFIIFLSAKSILHVAKIQSRGRAILFHLSVSRTAGYESRRLTVSKSQKKNTQLVLRVALA